MHPHLHFLVTEGEVDAAGVFHQIACLDDSRLAEVFAREVLAMLVRKELLSPEWAERIPSWRHTSFNVHSLVRAKTKPEAERVGKYMIRPVLALDRLTFLEPVGKVGYRWDRDISAELMFVSQCVINFFVHSGTAQAALTIPIMAPLGDLVGITRQTSVFAFQLAEYINPVLPTSGVTMEVLGLAGLKWEKWAKWMVPLLLLWVLFAALTLIPPVLMKWGPA